MDPAPTRTRTIDREAIVQWFALSATERDARLQRELVVFSLVRAPLLFVTGRRNVVWRAFTLYRDAKRWSQKKLGHGLAVALGRRGNDICNRIRYCERRAQFLKLFEISDHGEFAAVAAAYSEEIDAIREVAEEVIEAVGDTAIPIAFILQAIREGLDELCRCCERCGGSGHTDDGKVCPVCEGTGKQPG